MAVELLSRYRRSISELQMVPSHGGCFEVSLDGEIIFSKLEEGRFPEPGELKSAIEARRPRLRRGLVARLFRLN